MTGGENFDERAATWDDQRHLDRAARFRELITGFWGTWRPARVLDFGCATGLLSLPWASPDTEVIGFDPSVGMREVFEANAQGLNARAIGELSECPSDVEALVSSMAFHHAGEIGAELEQLRPLLAPGARVAIIDLDSDDGKVHENVPEFTGHNGFDRGAFAKHLADAGFTDVHVRYASTETKQREDETFEYSLFLATALKAG